MPTMNIIQAVNDALRLEMRRDPDVVVLGEDVGKFGGVFRATQGLYDEFGADRVIDTPLAEGGIVGTAVGMALYGLRPVPEIQFADFIFPAFDQIVNEVAKYRYRSGGQYACPMVIRTPYGGGIRGGHYHSQSPETHFVHTAGLKVVVPSNPYDAKGLLISAIRDPDPVLFFEPKRVYRAAKGEVPEGEYVVPIGKARVTREGSAGDARRLGRDVARGRPGRARGGGGGHRLRGHRPALAAAARHRDARRIGEEDRPRGRRARGAAHLRVRRGAHGAHPGAVLPPPRGAHHARDRVRHAVPVHAREEYLPRAPRILKAIREVAY